MYVPEEEWNNKQLAKPKQPSIPKTQSTIHVTEDGAIRRIGKTSGIDYLREQREERMQRQKLADINESIAKLYNKQEDEKKLAPEMLQDLIQRAQAENAKFEATTSCMDSEVGTLEKAN